MLRGVGLPSAFQALSLYGIGKGLSINGLGDSITAQSVYFPVSASIALAPQWLALTLYSSGSIVQNNGLLYLSGGGTSGNSGGPTGTTPATDGNITWTYIANYARKQNTSYLYWAETFSLGSLVWDMSQGYAAIANSLFNVYVINGGSGYTAPTITFNNGATGTVQKSGGRITGVTITNPGYANPSSFTYSLSDPDGSGAVLSLVSMPSGTFGVPGCTTTDMVARLADCLASTVDIFVVHGGTNDLTQGVSYATIVANLKICYETLASAGKIVVAMPIIPRKFSNGGSSLTAAQLTVMKRVNRWIRAYFRKETQWANPLGVRILLADATRYITDGTSATGDPIGGSAAANAAMTQDGVHPSARGAMYMGKAIFDALSPVIGNAPTTVSRIADSADGYDATTSPGGNFLEAPAWQASTNYVAQNNNVSNGGNVYRCKTTGISASSGGPTTTSSDITDGTAHWAYLRPVGASVFASGTGGTQTAASGIVYSGSLAGGYTIQRLTGGTASGTVACSIENPWSDGQPGNRQSISFSLSGGNAKEQWAIYAISSNLSGVGFPTSELANGYWYAEWEIEISAASNVSQIKGRFDDNGGVLKGESGFIKDANSSTSLTLMNSSGEMLDIPNSGKLLIKTQPSQLPSNLATLVDYLTIGFDATSSAALTLKINYHAIRKAYVA